MFHRTASTTMSGSHAAHILSAANQLLPVIEAGRPVSRGLLRSAMQSAFAATDASGAWSWKDAYEACEVATVLFLRKYGQALSSRAPKPEQRLELFARIARLLPTQTRRSEESQALQQFSTPITLGLAAITAADVRMDDRVLEPSAGTGLLAILAEIAGALLILNEIAETRVDILASLFPNAPLARVDAANIHDHLDQDLAPPTVVVMNPPFSALAHVERRMPDAAYRHIASALARLAPGGRLVTITGAGFSPDAPQWRDAFIHLQEQGRLVFSAPIAGSVYAAHGVSLPTRLTVIDKVPADDPTVLAPSAGTAADAAALLAALRTLPPRSPVDGLAASSPMVGSSRRFPTSPSPRHALGRTPRCTEPAAVALDYETLSWTGDIGAHLSDSVFEPFALQTIRIPGAKPHPTQLVQSAAMASVAPPRPSYRPRLPVTVVNEGLLSDAQLETVILAGEAHSAHLDGDWIVDPTFDRITPAPDGTENSVRFRRGFMLGDGTGAGKGRQAAGIILDNWMQGRRRAVWLSKSDTLLEAAQRDWSALGMERLLVTPLSRWAQGRPITLSEGILFATYATMRSEERGGKGSRVRQLVDWLGVDFDGVIIIDESHALQNAAGAKGERGDVAASQQGRAGLRLQRALPNARVVYVSATAATTVHNLAYAERLGLWIGGEFPFANRSEFVSAIDAGGVAAMEVVARDLRALGLYTARTLSYDGVEYEIIQHALTEQQRNISDAYANAFIIIHNNLNAALEAANITGTSGTLNSQAKSAARSAFETAKQRFFGHLLTSMATPSVIQSIAQDLRDGKAAIVQITSTGEALMERRLSEIPTEEWNDISVDITPREYVLDYLAHSFPVQLFEPYTDGDGNLLSRPVFREGQPVECRAAVDRRNRMIEHLASLPPVPGALDQIVQHFGTDIVAEITGRSRRIVRRDHRLAVESRKGNVNLSEIAAFMDDRKRVLVFSEAGGTGLSYHADLGATNQRRRHHYVLEPGWKADAAIQGLGRSHRTNETSAPLLRPVATDVKAQRRFLSTIARRLDSLGAITRGQRETAGQGLFRPEDNLEGVYAQHALRQLYRLIVRGKVDGCSLDRFQATTGLSLVDGTGLREDLPPITTFLNRMLALPIDLQNTIFSTFEELHDAAVSGAVANGTYDSGLETLHAESFVVNARTTIYTHAASGAVTELLTIGRRDRLRVRTLADVLERARESKAVLVVNSRSGNAALQLPAPAAVLDSGDIEERVLLLRPAGQRYASASAMVASHWEPSDRDAFRAAWLAESAALPQFEDSTLHIVTGLLLPIWKRLPEESPRVFRLQTDAGERLIGRLVSPAWAASAATTGVSSLTPHAAHDALAGGEIALDLRDGLQLRRTRVMGADRIELTGFSQTEIDNLRSLGMFSEIISWKLRVFVPIDEKGRSVLESLLNKHPIDRVSERRAA